MREPNYVWRDPSGSLTISISLRLLSRLVTAGQNAAAAGWLLGRSGLHDGVHLVSIEDSAPGAASLVPGAVGMYRILRSSEPLSIQPNEEDLFRQRFIGENNVFLAIQPGFGRAALFTATDNEFVPRHEFTFRAPEPRKTWMPAVARSRHWMFEVLALVLGLVAGVMLIQHFQPPPSVAQVALKAPPPLQPAAGDAAAPSDTAGEPLTAEVPPESPSSGKPSPWESRTAARSEPSESESRSSPFPGAAKPAPPPVAKTAPPAVKPTPQAPSSAPVPATPVTVTPAQTPPPVEHAAAAPPPRNIPPVTRSLPKEPEPQITVQAEPVASSRLSKAIGHVPLLRRLGHKGPAVVPPAPVRQVSPHLSARERAELTDPVLVNVRVYVNESGKVEFAELMSDARRHPNLSSAAVYASRRWDFTPAAQGGQPVPGEMILHYRFAPPGPPAANVTGQN